MLDVISTFAVSLSAIVGAVAAVAVAIQVVHMRKNRDVEAFLKILDRGNESRVSDAAEWIKYEMQNSLSYDQAFKDRTIWRNISAVNHYFEMIGVLVDNRYISRDLIYDQMGPWIVGTWSKLRELISRHRSARSAPDYCENFELLALGYRDWIAKHPPKLEKRPRVDFSSVENYYANAKQKPTPGA